MGMTTKGGGGGLYSQKDWLFKNTLRLLVWGKGRVHGRVCDVARLGEACVGGMGV